mmetsp:Transcript_12505/g.13708  ORF Transcript_12505/g.13708 Transcript_12505/m.13708 type:complete len:403 (+) Transcript_12505:391-1599(+)
MGSTKRARMEADPTQMPPSKQREHALRSFNRLLIREKEFFEKTLKDEDCKKTFKYIVGDGQPFFKKVGQKSWSRETMDSMAALKGFHKFVTQIHHLAVKVDTRNTTKYCRMFMVYIQNYDCPTCTNRLRAEQHNCPELEGLLSKFHSAGHKTLKPRSDSITVESNGSSMSSNFRTDRELMAIANGEPVTLGTQYQDEDTLSFKRQKIDGSFNNPLVGVKLANPNDDGHKISSLQLAGNKLPAINLHSTHSSSSLSSPSSGGHVNGTTPTLTQVPIANSGGLASTSIPSWAAEYHNSRPNVGDGGDKSKNPGYNHGGSSLVVNQYHTLPYNNMNQSFVLTPVNSRPVQNQVSPLFTPQFVYNQQRQQQGWSASNSTANGGGTNVFGYPMGNQTSQGHSFGNWY